MKKVVSLIAVFLLFYTSCKDKNGAEIDYNPNVLSSRDYVRGEDAIFEVINSFFKGIYDSLVNENGYAFIDNCDVTYWQADNTLHFGYGSTNRLCQDSKFRKGNFDASFSGEIFMEGVTAHIQTDSLYVDNCLVELTMDIENLGLNNESRNEYSLKVENSNIILPDTLKTTGVKIQSDYLLTWEQGFNTPEIHEDDMYQVSGTASGTSSDGYNFSLVIEQPFENWLDCYWLDTGISRITVPSAAYETGEIIKRDSCSNAYNFYFNENYFYDIIK